MQRKSLRSSPVAVYMSALALVDSVVLILDFINNWLKMKYKVFLLNNYTFCIFHRFFFNLCFTYATWLVAAVACERFIVVTFPFKAKNICTMKGAVKVVLIQPFAIFVLTFYEFWGWDLDENGRCDVHKHRMYWFMSNVAPWIKAILYSYLPVLIIIICNIGIIFQLSRARAERLNLGTGEASSVVNTKITIMVVMICLVFLVLTVPISLWYIILFAAGEFIEQGPKTTFIEVIILIFGLLNHGINFFLYILSSESFRKEFVAMMRCQESVTPAQHHSKLYETHSSLDGSDISKRENDGQDKVDHRPK